MRAHTLVVVLFIFSTAAFGQNRPEFNKQPVIKPPTPRTYQPTNPLPGPDESTGTTLFEHYQAAVANLIETRRAGAVAVQQSIADVQSTFSFKTCHTVNSLCDEVFKDVANQVYEPVTQLEYDSQRARAKAVHSSQLVVQRFDTLSPTQQAAFSATIGALTNDLREYPDVANIGDHMAIEVSLAATYFYGGFAQSNIQLQIFDKYALGELKKALRLADATQVLLDCHE